MRAIKYILLGLLASGIMVTACRKPYNPTIVSTDNSYLVVEGTINSGDITNIRLSKTVKIATDTKVQPLLGATVSVEEQGGAAFALTYNYTSNKYDSGSALNLDQTKKYRLHIVVDGKEYASDYVAVKNNPPIDKINFKPNGDKLEISVDTHDPTNNTRYYRWDFDETWRFHANYQSDYLVDDAKNIRLRTNDQMTYYCFASDTSSNVLIASSAKLSQDVISQSLINTIPSSSEKLELRYSILIRQYAISKDEYEFWQNIQKNTEQLGSIFDAQPSQLNGNVHCITNPAEPVIGYVSATNIQQKRIFINNSQLPQTWFQTSPYSCSLDSALYFNPKTMRNEVEAYILDGGGVPVESITQGGYIVIGYTYSGRECTDCTIRGKVQQPSYWVP
ncbi:DUF4249 domain-containing protein [Mucilaginibacter flavus]|uniref:DUF4249 domain-containing protein n=1 Tax=Mucilaginibacter flavus TaxID=931504 RepID=UPI0025B40128|nr:DUF4249 domain-containing protein [Mucilaginibacter flavus]MDN3581477.1 DUF4249 domain-containing protein [Mucilaginibacter flavus]